MKKSVMLASAGLAALITANCTDIRKTYNTAIPYTPPPTTVASDCLPGHWEHENYSGLGVKVKTRVQGFEEAYRLEDGGLVARCGTLSYLFDKTGKLLAPPAHEIGREDGKIKTSFGTCTSFRELDLGAVRQILEQEKASKTSYLDDICEKHGYTQETQVAIKILVGHLRLGSDGVYLQWHRKQAGLAS